MTNEQKEKLELKINIPAIMTIKKCFKEGESEYGKWWGYNVIHDGAEKTFFASEAIQNQIDPLLKANRNTFTLVKTGNPKGAGFFYTASLPNKEESFSADLDKTSVAMETEEKTDTVKDNIRWCNALNNACLLVAHKVLARDTENLTTSELVEKTANWIYTLEPTKKTPKELMEEGRAEAQEEISMEDLEGTGTYGQEGIDADKR